MACFYYSLKTYSAEGSFNIEGKLVLPVQDITLEDFLKEISKKLGEDLNLVSADHGDHLILVNKMRVDWEREKKMLLFDGDQLVWIAPPFGG